MAAKAPGAVPTAAPGSHPALAPRWGEPRKVYETRDARGLVSVIQADENGVVWPSTPEEARLADALGLPLTIDPRPVNAEAAPAAKES